MWNEEDNYDITTPSKTLLKRGSKTLTPLTSYDMKFWNDFHSLRHKLKIVQ